MYAVICDETLLCVVQLDWAVVVVLVPNSFDLLTGGGSQLVVDVNVDSLTDVSVLHLYRANSYTQVYQSY